MTNRGTRHTEIYRASFAFKDRSVALSTHDIAVISTLSALFDLPFCEHGPTDSSVLLRKVADTFIIQTSRRYKQYDTISGAIVALAQTIPFMLLPRPHSYVLHGGAFIAEGKAHLFLGPGYVGKSTMALEAWLMGYEILGDDYLLLDLQTPTLQAIPKPLKLRTNNNILPERLAQIIEPGDYSLGYVEDSWNLVLSRQLPRMVSLGREVPIGSIYLLQRTEGNSASCHPAEKVQFIRSVYQHLVSAPQNNLDILRCLCTVFSAGHVFELRIGNNATVPALAEMIANTRLPC